MLWGLPEPLQVLVIPQGFSQGLGTLITHFVSPEPEKTNKNHTLSESFSVDVFLWSQSPSCTHSQIKALKGLTRACRHKQAVLLLSLG